MRYPYAQLLSLAALLCAACAPEAPTPPAPAPAPAPVVAEVAIRATPTPPASLSTPVKPTAAPDILGWWDRPAALAELGLTPAEGAAMAAQLGKLERAYQTAQRQLRQVRRTQMLMLEDPKVPGADIKRFNQRNLQYLLSTMLDQNIAARLWVREQLSAEQRARVLQRSPRFFGLRWFRAAHQAE